MQTGWMQLNNKIYYLKDSREMTVGTNNCRWITYNFNESRHFIN